MNRPTQCDSDPKGRRPLLAAAGAALVLATAMAAFPTPLEAQEGAVFHACFVPGSGTVYRIKAPGLRQDCASPNHEEFSWNAEGEPGPEGAPGAPGEQGEQGEPGPAGGLLGVELIDRQLVIPGGEERSTSLACPEGKLATGAGYSRPLIPRVDMDVPQFAPVRVTDAEGVSRPVGWGIAGSNRSETETTLTLWVVCAAGP